MSHKQVYVGNFAEAVAAELAAYSDEVTEAVKAECNDVADDCLREIKANSPVQTGKYKKAWRKKVEFENREDIRIRVFNAKYPGLTHLLEKGHAKAGGGRVEGMPHIQPAEQHAAERLVDKVKVKIR